VFAGHSIGELPAAVLAGALSSDDAMRLARERGTAMAAACAVADTGMVAVLGGDPGEVDAALAAAGLVAANRNGAGQVVAAGPRDGLERLAANPPPKARLRALEVAGAFHTEAMRPAQTALAGVAVEVGFSDLSAPLLSNADGAGVADAADLRRRLVAQVAAPVLWDACMARMAGLGVTTMLELAPGGTLTGLAKRALRGVATVALRTPDDLPAATELLAGAGAVGAAR
jgi:[acyl-carrier-protein] S-malonyltransferase